MLEKLLENWLDSTSERNYQPAFVQMLNANGYSVVHSTRHSAWEFGKDVIAVAPDGVPCGFQLKGNPGGRMGLAEFRRDIQEQLVQLMSQPIVFPGIPVGSQRTYLVSNGYFDEEVHRAVDDMNRGPLPFKVTLWSRGHLLEWGKDLGTALWPKEVADEKRFLELYLYDGAAPFPITEFNPLIETILFLRGEKTPNKAELQRAACSGALAMGVLLRPFEESKNFAALASGWCYFLVSLIAAFEKNATPIEGAARGSFELAHGSLRDALIGLWTEVRGRHHLVEGDAHVDSEIYAWRITLVHALLAVLWFYPCTLDEDEQRRRSIMEWVRGRSDRSELWGEGAIPQLLAGIFLRKRILGTLQPEGDLVRLFSTVVHCNQRNSAVALPDPYYSFEDAFRARKNLIPTKDSASLLQEEFAGSAYGAELLLHLVARARLKRACVVTWPAFNRLAHRRILYSNLWEFCMLRAEDATEESRHFPAEKSWPALLEEADSIKCECVPDELLKRPHLLLLWVIISPHRLNTEVGRYLSAQLPQRNFS